MTREEQVAAINALCIAGHYNTLYRVLNGIPGSKAILISDQPAELKNRELLKLLKRGKAQTVAAVGPLVEPRYLDRIGNSIS